MLGGAIAWGGLAGKEASGGGDPRLVGMIFLVVGLVVLALGLSATVLTWLAGRWVRDRRRRVFCLVVAALCCLQVPWGTVVGVCTFIVLGRPEVKAL